MTMAILIVGHEHKSAHIRLGYRDHPCAQTRALKKTLSLSMANPTRLDHALEPSGVPSLVVNVTRTTFLQMRPEPHYEPLHNPLRTL